ncbi:MAG: hypothetical protein GXP28_00730, partial [Planctomycetes bacterium]|nr:hypothetical protein [Planctomycetota bacterium]
ERVLERSFPLLESALQAQETGGPSESNGEGAAPLAIEPAVASSLDALLGATTPAETPPVAEASVPDVSEPMPPSSEEPETPRPDEANPGLL